MRPSLRLSSFLIVSLMLFGWSHRFAQAGENQGIDDVLFTVEPEPSPSATPEITDPTNGTPTDGDITPGDNTGPGDQNTGGNNDANNNDDDPPAPVAIKISGTLTNRNTFQPEAGASVQISYALTTNLNDQAVVSVVTDANGHYETNIVPPADGSYFVYVSVQTGGNADCTINKNSGDQVLDLLY
jgi:hypothetical protein